MKSTHKLAVGGTLAALAALLTVGVEIYDRFETWQREHVAADLQRDFRCEVKDCESRGGKWWKGSCVVRRR